MTLFSQGTKRSRSFPHLQPVNRTAVRKVSVMARTATKPGKLYKRYKQKREEKRQRGRNGSKRHKNKKKRGGFNEGKRKLRRGKTQMASLEQANRLPLPAKPKSRCSRDERVVREFSRSNCASAAPTRSPPHHGATTLQLQQTFWCDFPRQHARCLSRTTRHKLTFCHERFRVH